MTNPLSKMAEGYTQNKLIGFFLILWALTFLFCALDDILWLADGYASTADVILYGLWSLVELGCAAVLALLGTKFLDKKE
jgi:hypothetical protein